MADPIARSAALLALSIVSILSLAPPARGAGAPPDTAWTGRGLAVSAAANAQGAPALARADGGGILLAWEDARSHPDTTRIYAQRLLADGTAATGWPEGGVRCSPSAGQQATPQVIADGAGGLIVVWEDYRSAATPRVYAQRLDPLGAPATGWPSTGRRLCDRSAAQRAARIVSDGAGGALVVWEDYRSTPARIYAQHVQSDGTFAPGWPDSGKSVASASGGQVAPVAVADGAGGVYVAWNDGRGGAGSSIDVYAQRLKGDGVPATGWPGAGIAVCAAGSAQGRPEIALDGLGGAYVVWSDPRNGNFQVYAQRLTGAGGFWPGWLADGNAVVPTAQDQFEPVVAGDGFGRAYIAWADTRLGNGNSDLYIQRMNGDGSALWAEEGVGVCTATGNQLVPRLAADGFGGVLAAWQDARLVTETRIFAQRLADTGDRYPGWPLDGRQVADTNLVLEPPVMVASGDGGAYFAWSGAAQPAGPSAPDLYAGRVAGNSLVPALATAILARAEAGRVSLRWWVPPATPWVSVERRREGEAWASISGALAASSGLVDFEDRDVAAGVRYGYRLTSAEGAAGETWVTVPAAGLALALRGARPAADRAVLAVTLESGEPATLELFDVAGRRRWSRALTGTGESFELTVDTSRLEPGLYVARLRQGGRAASVRLPIAR